jgi:hypothetical protein
MENEQVVQRGDPDGTALERLWAYATHPSRAHLPFGKDLAAIATEFAALSTADADDGLIERLRDMAAEIDSDWAADIQEGADAPCPRNVPGEAADRIQSLTRELAEAKEALVEERTENLWNAYNTGHSKDGQWTHMFMSDGEWLARECGFDPRDGYYVDASIRNAIPKAALRALQPKDTDHG